MLSASNCKFPLIFHVGEVDFPPKQRCGTAGASFAFHVLFPRVPCEEQHKEDLKWGLKLGNDFSWMLHLRRGSGLEFCGCLLVWIEAVSGFGRRGKEGGDFSEMCPKNPRRKENNPCKAEIRSKQIWLFFSELYSFSWLPSSFSQVTLTPLNSSSLHRIFHNFPCFLQLPTMLDTALLYLCFSQAHFIHFY